MPGLWEWVCLGQVVGDMAEDSVRQGIEARKNLNQYEDTLVELAIVQTKKWQVLEDTILLVKRTNFSEDTVDALRQDARASRIEAMGEAARHRVEDPVEDQYKPLWTIFREMADMEAQLYSDIIKACDEKTLDSLDHALSTAQYCVSLGEQAILTMPAITAARLNAEQAKTQTARTNFLKWTVGCSVAFCVSLVGCAVCVGAAV